MRTAISLLGSIVLLAGCGGEVSPSAQWYPSNATLQSYGIARYQVDDSVATHVVNFQDAQQKPMGSFVVDHATSRMDLVWNGRLTSLTQSESGLQIDADGQRGYLLEQGGTLDADPIAEQIAASHPTELALFTVLGVETDVSHVSTSSHNQACPCCDQNHGSWACIWCMLQWTAGHHATC